MLCVCDITGAASYQFAFFRKHPQGREIYCFYRCCFCIGRRNAHSSSQFLFYQYRNVFSMAQAALCCWYPSVLSSSVSHSCASVLRHEQSGRMVCCSKQNRLASYRDCWVAAWWILETDRYITGFSYGHLSPGEGGATTVPDREMMMDTSLLFSAFFSFLREEWVIPAI